MTKPAMKMSEIYSAISISKEISTTKAYALSAAIEFLAGLEGVPVSALNLAAPEFSKKYPQVPVDGNYRGLPFSAYLKWRRVLLDLQMLHSPGDVDGCPWLSLGRAFRLATGSKSGNFLPYLRAALPENISPKDMDDEILGITEKALSGKKSSLFRQDVRAFSALSDLDLVRRSGLMPTSRITPPPIIVGHIHHAAMSDEIRTFRRGLLKTTDTHALDFANRLAVSSGLLNGVTDTLEDLVKTFATLPAPDSVGMPSVNENTINRCLTRVRCLTALPDPRHPPVLRAWEHLRAQARKMGCKTDYLWALAQCAERHGLSPCDLATESAELMLQSLTTSVDKAHFRRGCYQFDAYFGELANDLLPTEQLGIIRPTPAPPKPPKVENPVNIAWSEFYVRLRHEGMTARDIGNKLSILRVAATRSALRPTEINQNWIDKLDATYLQKDRTRLSVAVNMLRRLQNDHSYGLAELKCPVDRRRSHGGSSEQIAQELEKYFEEMNFSSSSRREFRVAVGALSDTLGRKDMSWEDVLSMDMDSIDWQNHIQRRDAYIVLIKRIQEWFSLPWTADWHALQWAISRAGISAINTPVPKILRFTGGRNPADLDQLWAKETDRDLRSTIKNPPHGRADMALTLCRNLKALDELWSVPALAKSGLLPDIIGNVRP
jgi:hypothetical protein